jgi:AraC family transcriptional regulator
MNPEPKIEYLAEKKLIGKRVSMSFIENKTPELWRSFMPRRGEIKNKVNADFISLQIHDSPLGLLHFNPATKFEKWAAVEVTNFDEVPGEMETFLLPAGLYAIFHYKGLSTDTSIFQYIFSQWLPNSGYELDHRPHFEILGEKYKNGNPDSEEDIFIPVKPVVRA